MNELGLLYLDGKGVQCDKKEAARLFKMASDRGDCAAMYNYAYILENGLGCPSDRQEAFRYYKMSADLGNYNAMKKSGTTSKSRRLLNCLKEFFF